MEHLWSPWRMAYLRKEDGSGEPDGCIFCDLPAEQDDARTLIVRRGRLAYVILNRYPYNNGHLLVVPFQHTPSLENLDPATLAEIMALVNESLAALRAMYGAEAFNLGANIGAAAGAGIASHVHMHVVPRWPGDTNFLSTLAGTRVIPEDLQDTYRLARQHWPGGAAK
ncbi:MAG: HIT domain-containing protein [Anaerolineales bacterium]